MNCLDMKLQFGINNETFFTLLTLERSPLLVNCLDVDPQWVFLKKTFCWHWKRLIFSLTVRVCCFNVVELLKSLSHLNCFTASLEPEFGLVASFGPSSNFSSVVGAVVSGASERSSSPDSSLWASLALSGRPGDLGDLVRIGELFPDRAVVRKSSSIRWLRRWKSRPVFERNILGQDGHLVNSSVDILDELEVPGSTLDLDALRESEWRMKPPLA